MFRAKPSAGGAPASHREHQRQSHRRRARYLLPGVSDAHTHIASFVELGMTPLEAIRSATTGAADLLGTGCGR